MKKLLFVIFFFFISSAHASLIDRGSGLIYDTDLDVTWLQNANASGNLTDPGQALS